MKSVMKFTVLGSILFFVGAVFFVQNGAHQNMLDISETSEKQGWKTYANQAYGYHVSYPPNAIVASHSEDTTQLDQIADVEISIIGQTTLFFVTAYIPYGDVSESFVRERNTIVTLPLRQFAEALRQWQVNNQNPSMTGRQVGEFKAITFAGKKAYSFTLTKGFSESPDGQYGYMLPEGVTYNFIIVENGKGQKLLIHYPNTMQVAKQIESTFKFD